MAWRRPPVGVALLNVIRPVVAVAVYVAHVAHALHEHPESRRRLADREADYDDRFVQEVRRLYPFFPAVAARVRDDFEWRGHRFAKGTRVLLDLHGTTRDPRLWDAPESFPPDRFADRPAADPAAGDPFALVPQGGGDHRAGHRCAGEWATLELMKRAAAFLSGGPGGVAYDVPGQDLRIDTSRPPALPRSRFVIRNVRAVD